MKKHLQFSEKCGMIEKHLKSACLFRMAGEVNARNDIKSDSPLTGTISGHFYMTVLPAFVLRTGTVYECLKNQEENHGRIKNHQQC